MQVETFECEETATEPVDASAEAIALIEQLGLTGQQKLLTKSSETTSRCPYRKMTKDEAFVYGMLCPQKTLLAEYGDEPMPLRVLQVAAHAKDLDFFEDLHVWHRESADIKDPVLVGSKKEPGKYGSTTCLYILARWGEVLDEWPALSKAALARWKEKSTAAFNKIIGEAQANLAQVDSMSFDGAITKGMPSSYGW